MQGKSKTGLLKRHHDDLDQRCTGKNVCPPKWCACLDDVMSQIELTTSIAQGFVNLLGNKLSSSTLKVIRLSSASASA